MCASHHAHQPEGAVMLWHILEVLARACNPTMGNNAAADRLSRSRAASRQAQEALYARSSGDRAPGGTRGTDALSGNSDGDARSGLHGSSRRERRFGAVCLMVLGAVPLLSFTGCDGDGVLDTVPIAWSEVVSCGPDMSGTYSDGQFRFDPGNSTCAATLNGEQPSTHDSPLTGGRIDLVCTLTTTCTTARVLEVVHPNGSCAPLHWVINPCNQPLQEPGYDGWFECDVRVDVSHYVSGYDRQVYVHSDDTGPSCHMQFWACRYEVRSQHTDQPACGRDRQRWGQW